jgi:hypothetical protein
LFCCVVYCIEQIRWRISLLSSPLLSSPLSFCVCPNYSVLDSSI